MDHALGQWPDPNALTDAELLAARDRAFLVFCTVSKRHRRRAWQRVLSYKLALDQRNKKG